MFLGAKSSRKKNKERLLVRACYVFLCTLAWLLFASTSLAWATSETYISDDLVPGSVEKSLEVSVQIEPTAGVELTPEHTGKGLPGETITYTHTIKNWGNYFDTFNITYTSSRGWTYKFYFDKNGDGILTDDEELKDTDGDGIIDTGVIDHCGEIKILKRVFIPGDAKLGTTDTMIMEITSTLNPDVKDQAVNTTHCENGGVLPFTGALVLPILWCAGVLIATGTKLFGGYRIKIVRR